MAYKILWFVLVGAFLVSAAFLGWLNGVLSFIQAFNVGFWDKMPWEFQLIFFGFSAIVPTFLIIYSFSGRD